LTATLDELGDEAPDKKAVLAAARKRHVRRSASTRGIEFPTLTVTREQVDGNQTSSGEEVLAGTAEPSG
jgi:hypothetical protein